VTNPLDEQLLRRALHDAVLDMDPSPGARERVLLAATPQEATDEDLDDDAAEVAATTPSRRRRTLLPLASAAAVLLITAVVLSLTTLGSPGGRGAPLANHRTSGIASGAPLLSTQQSGVKSATFGLNEAQGNLGYTTWSDGAIASASNTNSASGATSTVGATPAKVVAVGTIAMKVPSSKLQIVLAELTALVAGDGGYVSSSKVNATSNGTTSTATIVLRVPQHRFGSLVSRVQRYGTPTSVVTNSTDVTGQFVDYEARIAALEASRTQYLAILARAGSISDILAVQAQINDLQSQIEQLKGARNVLVNEAAYSSLTISLNPTGQSSTSSTASGLGTAWHDSIGGFVKGFEWLVRAAGPALFAMLCLIALLLLGRFGWRATRRRML
jgi:hypothetical protein